MRPRLLARPARLPGLYRQVVGAGAEPRTEAPNDALRAPADLGLVSTQCARDRVERLAVEKHREDRQIVILELRHRGSKTSRGTGAGRPRRAAAAEDGQQGSHGLGLVHTPSAGGASRQRQGGARVRGVDDHRRGLRAALDPLAMREPVAAREVVVEHEHVGPTPSSCVRELGERRGGGDDRQVGSESMSRRRPASTAG